MEKQNQAIPFIQSSIPDRNTNRFGQLSPWRLFIIIISSIFFAEVFAMLVVYILRSHSYLATTLIDAGMMVVLIFPILYWFSFRPSIRQIEKLQDAETKLESERARLRSILDTMPDGIYIVNQHFNVEYVNPVIEREFGLVGGQKCYSYFQDSNEACNWCKNPAVFTGGSVHWEWVSSRTGRTYEVLDTPLIDSDGSFSKLKIMHDVTERKHAEEKLRIAHDQLEVRVKDRTEELRIANSELEDEINVRRQAEEALKQSEQRLARAQEIAHLGSWELDISSDQLNWSDEVYRIFGLQPRQFDATYEAFLEAVHPDDRAAVDEAYSGSIRDGRDRYEIEHRVIKRSSGEIRTVHEKCEHIRDETGRIVRSMGMVHDISERKKAEEALRLAHAELELRVRERTEELAAANRELSSEIMERKEIERQLRIQTAAMEAAANGILITDPKGIILWTNPAITQISGYPACDLIGQSTHLFSSGRHDQSFYQQMWETVLSGKVWQGETTNRRKDGNLYIEEQTITAVRNEEGELTHFISVKQDVTERKLIYSQLEDSNRELRTLTASERQQRFLAEGLIESSVVLNMSLELHAVLDHIFEQTRRTIPYLVADIVLIEADTASVVRQWGFEGCSETRTLYENDNLKLQQFSTWERICETKSTILIPDTLMESGWDTYFGMVWIRSYLGAPLIYNDQVIGIINLTSDQAHAFHEDMEKNLRAFAAPAAVAIQNARRYETEQQNRKAAEILSSASVDLAQTLDIQMVMETILDYVQFVLPSDVAFVILSEGEERYRIRAVRAGEDRQALREALLDQPIDMLSDPIVRSYFAKYENTYIPDSREISGWHPPLALGSMNCWLGIPLESMGKILGIVVSANATPHAFARNQIQLLEAVIKQAVVALQNAWLFEQVRSGHERLQQLSRHLVEIQENERKYIARELHDETSQSLTSLKIGLQVIEQKAAGHQQLLEQVERLKSLADETLESLHRLAVNLRPASLDHLGLADALTGLIESIKQRAGITAHFKTMGAERATVMSNEMETSIYRIVQESLTNVIRHAQAAHVDIILEWQDEKVVVIVEDDGIGIDMQKTRESGHLGLIGMQERAEMLGGRLLVDSTPRVGTTLVVEIPYVYSNTLGR
jgi:PAS domain S-box-containing protein